MKNNKFSFVLIAVFFIVTLFACSKNTVNQTSETVDKTVKIGLVTDLGGINDHSFNQLSYEGLKNLQNKNSNVEISYLESKSFSDYGTNIDTFVNEGYDYIIVVGATFIDTLKEAANTYPTQKFIINGVDIGEHRDNVASLIFANEEAGYLSGVTAAMTTKTNTIGYIQGMELPTLNLFGSSYIEGAKSINPDIKILLHNANNFADLAGGNVAAANMIKNDADVIYQVAGATGIGVINACAENGIYAIGSDTDQKELAIDTVLLSTLEHIDNAVENYLSDILVNGFKNSIIVNNLSTGAIDLAYNDKILPAELKEKLESIKKDIINNKVKISKDAKDCPEFSFAK